MSTLHILPVEPDDKTRRLIKAISADNRGVEIKLDQNSVDYNELLNLIFASDRIITWWK